MTENANDLNYEEITNKINTFKQNLSQVQSIIDSHKEKLSLTFFNEGKVNTNINDLIKMEKDIKNSIAHMEDIKRFKLKTDPNIFNNNPLDPVSSIGKICSVYFELEKVWSMAMINTVNVEDKSAEITWLGYKTKDTVPWNYIKIQESINPNDLEVGTFCDAIYYEDGKWYQSVVEMVSEYGVHIKYKKYDNVEVLSFDSIRITPEQKILNQKRKESAQEKIKNPEQSELTFKLPEYLKVTPLDNEQQRLIKKKRAKSLKQSHKQKIIEKVSKEKQEEWINFKQNSKIKAGGYMPMKKIEKKPENR